MNVTTALQTAVANLQKAAISSASLDAELLLAHVLQQSREYVLAHGEAELTTKQKQEVNQLVKKRTNHVPVAYLTNQAYFYGRAFYVDERVLVPRWDTELLVEYALPYLSQTADKTVIDVGTGSGCIIVTLAKELQNQAEFFAIDSSNDALAVARKNAATHHVADAITFFQGNLLEPVRSVLQNATGTIVITANLPYVATAHVDAEPSIQHEPRLALDSGPDGLNHYRALARQARQLQGFRNLIKVSETSTTLLCEIGEEQAAAMRNIFSFAKNVVIKKDLAGRDRIAVITLGS